MVPAFLSSRGRLRVESEPVNLRIRLKKLLCFDRSDGSCGWVDGGVCMARGREDGVRFHSVIEAVECAQSVHILKINSTTNVAMSATTLLPWVCFFF